jgi:hypothetical protein
MFKNIKADNPPPWFDIDRYRQTSKLGTKEWFYQLRIRSDCYSFFNNFYSRVKTNPELFEIFQTEEIATAHIKKFNVITTQCLITEDTYNYFYPEDDYYKSFNKVISPLTVNDVLDIGMNDLYIDNLTNIKFFKDIKKENSESPLLMRAVDEINEQPERIRNIKVDLGASNKEILTAFKTWLHTTRDKDADISYKNNFNTVNYSQWSENCVLAFLDITIWSIIESVNIKNHVMGQFLFPNEYDVDLSEKIRKVTSPLALKLIKDETLVTMAYQINNGQGEAE